MRKKGNTDSQEETGNSAGDGVSRRAFLTASAVATPAIVRDGLIIRTESHVFRIK